MCIAKKFNQIWVNQTGLGKKFGLSAVQVGQILVEHELKDPKSGQATQKAVKGGYAKSTPLKNGVLFFMWNLQKTKDLISKKHTLLSEVGYWVNEVKKSLLEADHIYEEVPQKIRTEVKMKVERQ